MNDFIKFVFKLKQIGFHEIEPIMLNDWVTVKTNGVDITITSNKLHTSKNVVRNYTRDAVNFILFGKELKQQVHFSVTNPAIKSMFQCNDKPILTVVLNDGTVYDFECDDVDLHIKELPCQNPLNKV